MKSKCPHCGGNGGLFNMNVSIQWFDGAGQRAGCEKTTLDEIKSRLGPAFQPMPGFAPPTKLLGVARLATGEVARVYKQTAKAGGV